MYGYHRAACRTRCNGCSAAAGAGIALVGGAALLVRLPLLTANSSVTPGDGPIYFQVAHSLLDGNGLAGNDYRTPGYPIALVPALLADRVIGQGEAELVLAGQDLLGILLAIAVMLIGARHFGVKVGVPAGLLVAIAPVLLPIERMTYPDLLYACGLFAGAALLAEGVRRGGDRRWLIACGVVFGLSAWVKPAAQPLIVVPVLVMLLATRDWPRSAIGGAIAAAAMLATMAPWLVHNALDGTVGMNKQSGLTLFYRAFDDAPGDPGGCPLRKLMRQVAAEGRVSPTTLLVTRLDGARPPAAEPGRGLRRDGRCRPNGDPPNLGTYAVHSADDVRQTVGDLADTSPGEFEGFDYHRYLHDQLRATRVGVPPAAVAWGLVQIGLLLGVAWLAVTLTGDRASASVRRRRARASGRLRLSGDLAGGRRHHVARPRLAVAHLAGLAPLAWLAGCAGAWLVWAEVARKARSRFAVPPRVG